MHVTHLLTFALTFMMFMAGCDEDLFNGGATSVPPAIAAVKGKKWVLQSLTMAGKTTKPPKGVQATLMFDGNRMLGSGGCNSYDIDFSASKDGTFFIHSESWTEMACTNPAAMQLDDDLQQVFAKINTYSITAKKLVLADGAAKYQAVFVPWKAPAPLPLAGTKWNLKHFEENGGKGEAAFTSATSTLGDAPLTLLIKAGKASGSGGCNSFSFDAKIGDDTIEFKELTITEKACGKEVMRQEQQFIDRLRDATRYQIHGNQLRISDADGTHMLIFAGKP